MPTDRSARPTLRPKALFVSAVSIGALTACGPDTSDPTVSPEIRTQSSGLTATIPFTDGFEAGATLDPCWTTNSTANGRIRVATTNGPRSGTRHVLMDANPTSTLSLNELTLSIDLSGATGVRLIFWAREYGDEAHTLPATFTGSANGDGVSISADGTNWFRVQSLTTLTSAYQMFDIDLDAAIATAGIAYGPNFRIKFSQYDDFSVTTDGFGIDDVAVVDGNVDLTAPTGTVEINGGAATATTSQVLLTVTATDAASGVADMSFSNDGTTWSPWETFSSTRAWDLNDAMFGGTAVDGSKTAYARFRDVAQNISVPVTDMIVVATPPMAAAFPFTEDWESGAFGPMWTRASNPTHGQILNTTANIPRGSRHVVMDNPGGSSNNDLTLAIDLAGQTGVFLVFFAKDFSDESNTLPTTFTNTTNGDGVSISEDGVNWHRVLNIGPMLTATYQQFAIDLDAAIAAAGITYNSTFQIRFQQFDNSAATVDGIAWDDVQVFVPGPDTDPPTGTVIANNGAATTARASIELDLTATDVGLSGVADMRFSNDGTLFSPWEPFATTRANWDITNTTFGGGTAAGLKTVYAQFRDNAGNVSMSATDTITFNPPMNLCAAFTPSTIQDNATRSGSLSSADGQFIFDGRPNRYVDGYDLTIGGTGALTIDLTSSAFDPILYLFNGTTCQQLARDLDGGTGTNSQIVFNVTPGDYTIIVSTTMASALGAYTLMTSGMITDTTPPTGTIMINNGAATTASAIATLNLSATDAGGTGVDDMRFSNNGLTWSTWQTFATTRAGWDITAAAFGGNATAGVKRVFAQFRDGAGNVSTAVNDTITYSPPVPASFPFTETFESGSLGTMWASMPGANGRIQITTLNGPNMGTRHLTMDLATGSANVLNELVLTINLAGRTNVHLQFASKDFTDETNNLPTTWTGSTNGDGIGISADGNTWYSVWQGSLASGTYQNFDIDLDAAIQAAGISYNGNFRIKFQQYDNFAIPTDGFAFDDIAVRAVTPDTTAPTGTVQVNNNAASTTSLTVTLNLTGTDTGGSGLDEMQFSNNGVTWSAWQAFSTTRTGWNLSQFGGTSTPGLKTVRARLRDVAGNVSTTFSDSITYTVPDTTAPTGSISIANGAASTNSLVVTLNLSATDTGGSGLAQMQFSNNGTTWSAWEGYRTTRTNWDLRQFGGSSATGTKRVFARYRDAAMNVSASVNDTIVYTPPDTTAPTGSVSILNGAPTTANLVVSLNLSATDTGGSGLADMRFSNDGTRWSNWESYFTTKSGWDLSAAQFGGGGAPGTKPVFAQFRDGAGNMSMAVNDTIVFMPADVTPPTAPGQLTATAVAGNRIDLNWQASTDDNMVLSYIVERSLDGAAFTQLTTLPAMNTSYSDVGLTPGVGYFYRVSALDIAMNQSMFSNVAMAVTPSPDVDAGVVPDTGSPAMDAGVFDSGNVGDQDAAAPPPDVGPIDVGLDDGAIPMIDASIPDVRPDAGQGGMGGGAGGASGRVGSRRRRSGCTCYEGRNFGFSGTWAGLLLIAGVLLIRRRS